MKASSSIKALLFDMDGLLVDTEGLYIEVYRRMLELAGGSCDKATASWFVGRSTEDVCRRILELRPSCGMSMAGLEAQEEELYLEMLPDASPEPLPGVREMFEAAAQNQLPCALVSNSSAKKIDGVMSMLWVKLFGDERWEGVFKTVCDLTRVRNCKPSPDLYLLALSELGLDGKECLAFEDSPSGVAAADSAGCHVAVVPSAHVVADAFDSLRFDLKFKSLLEGTDWLLACFAERHGRFQL